MTVPVKALVVNHTNRSAGIDALLNDVVLKPVVVFVTVVPLVTTSVPAALTSVP